MDQVQLCLFVVLTFSCLHQLVTPIPMVIDGDLDYDKNVPVPITEDIFDLKDNTDMSDTTPLLLARYRRNTAQWVLGSQHFNDDNQANHRRFAQRRFNSRNNGRGQIADA